MAGYNPKSPKGKGNETVSNLKFPAWWGGGGWGFEEKDTLIYGRKCSHIIHQRKGLISTIYKTSVKLNINTTKPNSIKQWGEDMVLGDYLKMTSRQRKTARITDYQGNANQSNSENGLQQKWPQPRLAGQRWEFPIGENVLWAGLCGKLFRDPSRNCN